MFNNFLHSCFASDDHSLLFPGKYFKKKLVGFKEESEDTKKKNRSFWTLFWFKKPKLGSIMKNRRLEVRAQNKSLYPFLE